MGPMIVPATGWTSLTQQNDAAPLLELDPPGSNIAMEKETVFRPEAVDEARKAAENWEESQDIVEFFKSQQQEDEARASAKPGAGSDLSSDSSTQERLRPRESAGTTGTIPWSRNEGISHQSLTGSRYHR